MEEIIEKAVEKSFKILTELKKKGFSKETKLIIPVYQNNKRKKTKSEDEIRVSEQELRFIFIEQLNKIIPQGFYYSIETPTKCPYKFSDKGKDCKPVRRNEGQSGNFDLTIQNGDKEVVVIVEFKSKSASPHSYAKDLCKLWNKEEGLGDATLRYFINVFETMDKRTRNKLVQKITNNEYFKKQEGDVDAIIVCKSLTENQEEWEFFGNDRELKAL